jgi:predicted ATP-grasp superfamily ATP-dependent carboligase
MEAIKAAIIKTNASIVLPVDEPTILLLSRYGKSISDLATITPIPEFESFLIAKNKWLLAQWLKKNKFSCPPTMLLENSPDFYIKLNAMSFPVLLKPTESAGGIGIILFETALALKKDTEKIEKREEYIIQSVIKGYAIICNVLCIKGEIIAHTIQKSTINGAIPYSPARGNSFIKDKATLELITQITYKLEWTGVVNFDLYYDCDKKEITVLEMNPRFWGSLMGSLAAGINFPLLCCLCAKQTEIPKTDYQDITYINGTPALRILMKSIRNGTFLRKDREKFVFGFILNDPLPNIALYSKSLLWRFKKVLKIN